MNMYIRYNMCVLRTSISVANMRIQNLSGTKQPCHQCSQ